MAAPAIRIDLDRARAHWHLRQGLARRARKGADLAEVVAETGWLRTLGGVEVYLAARARIDAMSARDLDAAVAGSKLHVSPSVRGCIYLVPHAHLPLAMRVAEEQWRPRAERELEKLGVKKKEIDAIAAEVMKVSKKGGPLGTDAIRKAMPEGTVRSLGEAGKKVGVSSPLPHALRELEFAGSLERTLERGRLDTERYLWRIPEKRIFAGAKIPNDRGAVLAEIFFRHSGPATVKDFAAWTAFSQRDAKTAIDNAGLVPIAVEGFADEAFVHDADVAALRSKPEPTRNVSLLPFEDNYLVLHGGPAFLVDEAHHGRKVGSWGSSKATTLGAAKHLASRTIVIGDRVRGAWEWDDRADAIVFSTYDDLSPKERKAVEAEGEGLAGVLREIGHARSFSLDSVDAVRERAKRVKAGKI